MNFQIREAGLGDVEAIAVVHVASWRSTYKGIVSDKTLDGLSVQDRSAMWRRGLTNSLGREFLLVAEVESGALAGFASAGPERSGHPDYKGELFAIYLLEEYQRTGIGRTLVRAVVARLQEQGITSMIMWMLKANPNRDFAERLGGLNIASKMYQIGDQNLEAVAYGWKDFFLVIGG